jgi:glycosyltransferase involved in cell wall biosynthesis
MTLDVTVVVPTHNRRRYLTTTLSTVLAQRGVTFEVVVVDDGSSDDTAAFLARANDPRVRVLRHAVPLGVARSRNHGVDQARGRYVAFLDDDDLWAPEKLARQLAAAEGLPWALSNTVVVDNGLNVLSAGPLADAAAIARALPWRNSVPAGSSNVLADTAAVRRLGGFDEKLRHFADWDLWIRLSRLTAPATVNEPDVAYRFHGANASSAGRDAVSEATIVGKRAADLRDGQELDPTWVYRWIGWWSLHAGGRRDALWAYGRAVRGGDLSSSARLIAALLGPRLSQPLLRRPIDPTVRAAARSWLAAVAEESLARVAECAGSSQEGAEGQFGQEVVDAPGARLPTPQQ